MKRFGQPDTSLKAFGRTCWDAFRYDFTMKVLVAMAFITPALALRYGRMDIVLAMLAIYAVGVTIMYFVWRRLVKKGTWWLA